ncbi:metallophosphoesterase [Corynebacterium sp. ES2794-CONJ1]|uniref:metallophosphoesterase family protein n=1 Tax=unclassified Corynebacterium TaxID=2624378 RepID=UPI0021691D44|nr:MULTISPECIES: metallophosphoesterase [unclassified Corynebacterium]MCS4489127.1 metallophosphoesterase [Corynebacterium sp. ES2775-CONJ]MCS4490940.1 metallophosphoesterase [Corynebacterium sp. ES2715-CONJ3]MCS4531178.1 metallophosphoesterase [Corynebacterium sp. ES2730-CONJ]MCU9518546.1 metallophosphoesterase [Corynebacterium sp. ES2794-CONJ1]
MTQTLWAVADLHGAVKHNREMIESIKARDPSDWLIVAGDVAERTEVVIKILGKLRRTFSTVIWVPGNHELFMRTGDTFLGRAKYEELVRRCRQIDVLTPEDPYPVFHGRTVVPLFTLYDYSFRQPDLSVEQAVQAARDKGIMLTDEFAIAPFVDIRAWCWDRLAYSVKRLSRISGPTILVNHWPLVVEPVNQLTYKEIGLWCGTRHTRTWAQRYQAEAVVYGHLHNPGCLKVEGINHLEVSLGYPREWQATINSRQWPYPVVEAS